MVETEIGRPLKPVSDLLKFEVKGLYNFFLLSIGELIHYNFIILSTLSLTFQLP